MMWERIWEPCLEGISQDELRKLIYDFSPSPHGAKVKDMNAIVGMVSEEAEKRLSRKLTEEELLRLQDLINTRGGMPVWQEIQKAEDVAAYLSPPIGLGDIVSHQWSDGYDNGTICQVHKDGTVDVFRPYVHAADFSCAGRHEGSLSILTYIGVETCKDIHPKHLKMVRKNKTPIR